MPTIGLGDRACFGYCRISLWGGIAGFPREDRISSTKRCVVPKGLDVHTPAYPALPCRAPGCTVPAGLTAGWEAGEISRPKTLIWTSLANLAQDASPGVIKKHDSSPVGTAEDFPRLRRGIF